MLLKTSCASFKTFAPTDFAGFDVSLEKIYYYDNKSDKNRDSETSAFSS